MNDFIVQLLEANGYRKTRLLAILRAIQATYFHIPKEAITLLSRSLGLPVSHIISVVDFYSFFHSTPRGQYDILFSDSITDHMLDKQNLMNYLSHQCQVGIGQVRKDGRVSLDNTACTGMCDQGPAALINGYAVPRLDRPKIDLIAKLIEQGLPLAEWPEAIFQVDDLIWKSGLLLNSRLNPGESLLAADARGLDATLKEIDQSKLRGRGGAGFKTALKWQLCASEPEQERFVVCNADEGEPGTFKDRVLLNRYADWLIEGMTLASLLIKSQQGFLYLRGEYLHLFEPLQAKLAERRRNGLLGENILGKGWSFDIEICLGAGSYICGEESALIESLEGRSGIARNRPPYPVTEGYLNKPTIVDNVETFIAAAHIAIQGGNWFAAQGTEQSSGTKILSISGDTPQPGIYEVPFGTPIAAILEDCLAEDVLGIQVGGPSGTFISNREFHRQLAFEDLPSGGSFIIFNKQRDILEIVRNFTHFFADESCGFCTPCRVGTILLSEQIDKLYDGYGSVGDIVALQELGHLLKTNSHCGLGQNAANPMFNTLARYPEIYQSKIKFPHFGPGFNLDEALQVARKIAHRNDSEAHLSQSGD
jgi:[NiFe] hydrogenase diaphorase moiety large subunit